jgi:hypothetical protein
VHAWGIMVESAGRLRRVTGAIDPALPGSSRGRYSWDMSSAAIRHAVHVTVAVALGAFCVWLGSMHSALGHLQLKLRHGA